MLISESIDCPKARRNSDTYLSEYFFLSFFSRVLVPMLREHCIETLNINLTTSSLTYFEPENREVLCPLQMFCPMIIVHSVSVRKTNVDKL